MKSFRYVAVFLAVLFSLAVVGPAQAQGLTKVADGVYAYLDVKGAAPGNSFGANAGVIVGKDGVLVVDTLISAKEAGRFIRDIRALTKKPIKYVVNTHYHLDHSFGNAEFARLGAIIVAHAEDKEVLHREGEATLKAAAAGALGLTESDMEGTEIAYPVLSFTDRMEIDLGNQKVELIYPGPSHTTGSILVYLPARRVIFAGDILFTGYHPYLAEGDIAGWVKALDYIAGMDAEAIVPGHGPLSTTKDVGDMREYLSAFDRRASELCAGSDDIEAVTARMKASLPERPELEFMIRANVEETCPKKRAMGK